MDDSKRDPIDPINLRMNDGLESIQDNFSGALQAGCLKFDPDSNPFQRFMPHMEQRNTKLMQMNNENAAGNYRRYDGKVTVNNS